MKLYFYRGLSTKKKKSKNKKKMEAFRSAFGELGNLRAYLGTVPLIALTATADKTMRNVLMKCLGMRNVLKLIISPNKQNIRISRSKVTGFSCFNWLIAQLKLHKQSSPFTIVFCTTIREIATILSYFLMSLGEAAFIPGEGEKSGRSLLGVFHSGVFQKMKDVINTSFKDHQGPTRVVFATSALSMGVNFPDVEYIFHYGPSRSVVSQLQEAGRAGRNGQQAHNVVYFKGNHLTHCDAHIREAMKAESCLRVLLYKHFDDAVTPLEPPHLCCSICHRTCLCEGIKCGIPLFPFDTISEEQNTVCAVQIRSISDQDRKDFKEGLIEIQSSLSAGYVMFDSTSTLCHGFSSQLIEDLSLNIENIFSVKYLLGKFPITSVEHAVLIIELIHELFDDIADIDSIIAEARRMHNLTSLVQQQPEEENYLLDSLSDSDTD